MSGFGVTEDGPALERLYYSQLFYRSYHGHQQRHEIHIIFTWNNEAHINYVNRKYPSDGFLAGVYWVIQLLGDVIQVTFDATKWTRVMEDQWEIRPIKSMVTIAELNDFKIGKQIPACVLEARPLCDDFPELSHEITFSGIKPPHHILTLFYMPPTIRAPTVLQPLSFSREFNYEQLSVWLTNHQQFVGADYQEDINRLKDARINGYALLSLDESTLRQLGVSYGFILTLMDIIENLKRSEQPHDSEISLAPQQTPVTSIHHQSASSATGQPNQTKFVPSGYILTKQELQALNILLAPYTDEKLKELKLSIQKKQGDISREEVEKLLRKCGLMTTADRLKEDIEKGETVNE